MNNMHVDVWNQLWSNQCNPESITSDRLTIWEEENINARFPSEILNLYESYIPKIEQIIMLRPQIGNRVLKWKCVVQQQQFYYDYFS